MKSPPNPLQDRASCSGLMPSDGRVEIWVAAHVSLFLFTLCWSLQHRIDAAALSLWPKSYCFPLLNPERLYPQISDRIIGIIERIEYSMWPPYSSSSTYVLGNAAGRPTTLYTDWGNHISRWENKGRKDIYPKSMCSISYIFRSTVFFLISSVLSSCGFI